MLEKESLMPWIKAIEHLKVCNFQVYIKVSWHRFKSAKTATLCICEGSVVLIYKDTITLPDIFFVVSIREKRPEETPV